MTPERLRAIGKELLTELDCLVEELAAADVLNKNLGAMSKTVVEQLEAKNTKLHRQIDTLFAAIEHGDAKHRQWLKKKIDEHFGLYPDSYPSSRPSAIHDPYDPLEGGL